MSLDPAVRDAVAAVEDPELRLPIGALGIIAGVAVDGEVAAVSLAHPLDWADVHAELVDRVRAVATSVEGISRADVELRPMSQDELVVAARTLKGEPAANPLAVVDAGGGTGAGGAGAPPQSVHRRGTRVLAIASGKGGVGKSSVTTNISIVLAARGHRVAAVDADVWGFSLPRMFGVDRPPGLVDDVIVPPPAHGVRVISMGFFAGEDQAVIWRGPMLHKALEQFLTDVHWSEPDFLLVDLPPGTGDIALSMAQFLPRAEVVVVTTPQPAAQKVAQRSAAMADKVGLEVVGVIENMAWFTCDHGTRYELFGAGGGQELADQLGVPLLGQVPLVESLRAGGDVGRPIVVADPTNEAAQAFVRIAERLDVEVKATRIHHPELRIG